MLSFWLAALEWFCKHACDVPRRVRCVQYQSINVSPVAMKLKKLMPANIALRMTSVGLL
jgi:hypothetical protein